MNIDKEWKERLQEIQRYHCLESSGQGPLFTKDFTEDHPVHVCARKKKHTGPHKCQDFIIGFKECGFTWPTDQQLSAWEIALFEAGGEFVWCDQNECYLFEPAKTVPQPETFCV